MSRFFEELNDLIIETSKVKVLAIVMAILVFSGSVALGVAYWITHKH